MRFVVPLLILLLTTADAVAVDRTAADAQQFRKVLAESAPGDVIVLADGTWRDVDLEVVFDATADAPLTVRAQTPGNVILDGKSTVQIAGSHIVVEGLCFLEGQHEKGHVIEFRQDDRVATDCVLRDCAVINVRGAQTYVSLYGRRNRVERCYLRGKENNGPMLVVWVGDKPDEHVIARNFFAGRSPLGQNGGETLRIGTSQVSMNNSRTIVEHNYFQDCNGEAEIISNKSCENIYRYNTFKNCTGALVMRHGNRCTVEGNWFFGNNRPGTGGIRLIGEDHRIINNYLDSLAGEEFESALPIVNGIPNSKPNEYFRVKRAVVAFNSLVNCAQNITFGVGVGRRNRAEPPQDCTFANNLIVVPPGSTTQPIVRFQDQPTDTTWAGNIVYGADAGLDSPGVKTINPQLERDADGVWRAASNGAVAHAAAGSGGMISDDIEGRPRDADARSVGCFEVTSTAPATRRPLTATDVGPSWTVPQRPLPTTQPTDAQPEP